MGNIRDGVTPGWQFASDNCAGICPEAWAALAAVNIGAAASYGADQWTEGAIEQIRALLQAPQAQVYFVFNGTAANSLALAAMSQSYQGIVCHEAAHVNTDECAAPEFFSKGSKLLPLPGEGAKLDPQSLTALIERRTDVHFPRARAVTVSQPTEWGTLYRPEEIAAISAIAHSHGLVVHMDGARYANALAALPGVSAADLSWRAGIDVLALGGTKNGLNTTEVLVFFDTALARDFDCRVKQSGQLASKMRFQTCQWRAVLESGAWQRHAAHANAMARALAAATQAVGVRLARAVEVNAVFLQLPENAAQALFARGWHFYVLGAAGYRLMCSWATTQSDIDQFAHDLRQVLR